MIKAAVRNIILIVREDLQMENPGVLTVNKRATLKPLGGRLFRKHSRLTKVCPFTPFL